MNDDCNIITINKEIKSWQAYVVKGKTYAPGERLLTDVVGKNIEDIFELINTLRKYLIFVDKILEGKRHLDASGNEIDYEVFYNNFNTQIEKYASFKEIQESVGDLENVHDLLIYLVQAIVFITNFRGLKMDKTISPAEFNNGNIMFKINSKLNKKLKEFYATIDEIDYEAIASGVREIVASDDIPELNIGMIASVETVKSTDRDNGEVYDKIGKIINCIEGINVDKNIRIAVGLYIVKSMVIETEKILARESSKKSKLTIYVRL